MVWWPFAPQPERADTSEVTDLHSGAPPLYSTVTNILSSTLGRLMGALGAELVVFKGAVAFE